MTIKQQGGIFGRNPTFNDVTVDGTLTSGSVSSSSLQVSGSNENSLFYSDADGNLQTSANLTWDTGALGALNVGAQAYIQTTSSTNAEVGAQYGKILFYKSGSGIGATDFYSYSGSLYKTMELDRLGNLTLTNGNLVVQSGKGIDFSATSGTGTSELFDDYEEGTFTPTLNLYGGTPTTSGVYTKIGRQVFVDASVVLDGTADSSQFGIRNFPYAINSSSFGGAFITAYDGGATDIIFGAFSGYDGVAATTSSGGAVTYNSIGVSATIKITATYFVD